MGDRDTATPASYPGQMPSPYPVTTDDTVLAALQAHVGESLPKLSDYALNQVSHMRYAVDAAVRHLVDTGAITRTPLIPDPDATGKPCGIHPAARADAFCACGHIVAAHVRHPDRTLTCDLCSPAGQVTSTLEVTSSGYDEAWGHALQLAVHRENTIGEQQANRDLLADAEWFHGRLLAGPPKNDPIENDPIERDYYERNGT